MGNSSFADQCVNALADYHTNGNNGVHGMCYSDAKGSEKDSLKEGYCLLT